LLAARTPGCPIVIIDQSKSHESAKIVERFQDTCSDIDYVRSTRTGATTARNDGVARLDRELVLFTDDDCVVDPSWVTEWCTFLKSHPTVGLAFGTVAAAPFDERSGVIPNFHPGPDPCTYGRDLLGARLFKIGMGANMAMRRSAWLVTGGFDEGLGPGAAFPASEESDMAVRVTSHGFRVGENPRAEVVHYGYRAGADASRLWKGYSLAGGAVLAKHIRCGDRRAVRWLIGELGYGMWGVLGNCAAGRRPLGLNSVRSLVRGLFVSARYPVDRKHRTYVTAQGL
jgi:GT2 family glycosyltransferase